MLLPFNQASETLLLGLASFCRTTILSRKKSASVITPPRTDLHSSITPQEEDFVSAEKGDVVFPKTVECQCRQG